MWSTGERGTIHNQASRAPRVSIREHQDQSIGGEGLDVSRKACTQGQIFRGGREGGLPGANVFLYGVGGNSIEQLKSKRDRSEGDPRKRSASPERFLARREAGGEWEAENIKNSKLKEG